MSGSEWKWRPPRSEGIWRHGAAWAKPLVAAAPWVTLALLLAMFALIGGRLTAAPGVVFDLPDPVSGQATVPGMAALVLPSSHGEGDAHETLVFFDDARYTLSDDLSASALREQFAQRARDDAQGTLLLLADRRVSAGEIMKIVGFARESGVKQVQIAEKRR